MEPLINPIPFEKQIDHAIKQAVRSRMEDIVRFETQIACENVKKKIEAFGMEIAIDVASMIQTDRLEDAIQIRVIRRR